MAKEAHDTLKMTKRQAHRVYEILRLQVTNVHDDLEFKEYRLNVKQRLNIPYKVCTKVRHYMIDITLFKICGLVTETRE